jgi:hypothetical protein
LPLLTDAHNEKKKIQLGNWHVNKEKNYSYIKYIICVLFFFFMCVLERGKLNKKRKKEEKKKKKI